MTMTDPTEEDRQPAGPYAHAAPLYWQNGWRGILPLPGRAKKPVPTGWTGAAGVFPSYPDVHAWTEGPQGAGNIALRLPHHIVGIDVDNYDDKSGAATLTRLETAHGPLPPTWRSTSRGDGISGIRLYRVPEGLAWPGDLGGGIEIIQHRHRYTVAWPSVHPTGNTYRWINPDGADVIGQVPNVDELPDLPDTWIQGITRGQAATDIARADLDTAGAGAWLDQRAGAPDDPPCPAVRRALARHINDLTQHAHARHQTGLAATARLAHLAGEGHPGTITALTTFKKVWLHHLATGAGGRPPDPGEWDRLLSGAVQIAAAAHPDQPAGDPCDNPFHGLLNGAAVYVPSTQVSQRPGDDQWPHSPSPSNASSPPSNGSQTASPSSPVTSPDTSTTTPPPTVNGAEQAEPSSLRRLILTPASTIRPRRVHWLWDGRIALGTLALLAGREGLGKSTVAYWLTARITRGELPGEHAGTPRPVLVCATEDSWEHTIVPRLMAAGADLDLVYRVEVVSAGNIHVGLSLPKDLTATEAAAADLGAVLLLLDPLMSRLDSKLDSHRDSEVRQALEPLAAIADRANMAILGLIHHNKAGGSDPLDAVMGSKAFAAVARSVHTAMRDPEDELEERRLFGTPKNNLGRTDLPTLTFSIVGHCIPTDEGDAWTGRVEWGEDSTTTIRQAMETAMKGGGSEERTAAQEAGDWLCDWLVLQGGEAPSSDAKTAAHKVGIGPDSLKRGLKARKDLIGYRSEGFPRVTIWFVQSPAEPPTVGAVGSDSMESRSTKQSVQGPGGGAPTALTTLTGSDLRKRSVIAPPVGAVGAVGAVPPRARADCAPRLCKTCAGPLPEYLAKLNIACTTCRGAS